MSAELVERLQNEKAALITRTVELEQALAHERADAATWKKQLVIFKEGMAEAIADRDHERGLREAAEEKLTEARDEFLLRVAAYEVELAELSIQREAALRERDAGLEAANYCAGKLKAAEAALEVKS